MSPYRTPAPPAPELPPGMRDKVLLYAACANLVIALLCAFAGAWMGVATNLFCAFGLRQVWRIRRIMRGKP